MHGKRAVVTGAARGIGLATTARLAASGASVVGIDILADEGTAAFAALPSCATFRAMDVTDEGAWADLSAEITDTPPDVLVNNAGGLLGAVPLHEHSLELWQRTLQLNLTSVFLAMRAMIPLMSRSGGGSIINIASVSGVIGQTDGSAYQAAKAAVILLTRNAAMTYAQDGIRVNAISPSVIASPGLALDSDERTARFLARVPLGQAGTTEDVAAAVLYLASDASRYVTGVNLPVDGGYLA